MTNARKTRTKRFPAASDFGAKSGEAVHDLALVPELREAGLCDHEVRLVLELREGEEIPDDEGGGAELIPLFAVSLRRKGTKRWTKLGTTLDGWRFPPALVRRVADGYLERWLLEAKERCLEPVLFRYIAACPS